MAPTAWANALQAAPRASAAAACGSALVVFAEAHLAKTDSDADAAVPRPAIRADADLSWLAAWPAAVPSLISGVWLPMAAAILVKGPVALLLALTTVAALSAWHRNMRWLKLLRAGRGILILLLVTMPAAIMVTLATDGAFLDSGLPRGFPVEGEERSGSHGAPVGTYLALAALLIWPASLLLPRAASQLPLLLSHVESRFLLAWALPFWLLIEFVPTKLPHYPLPVIPAIMVLLVCAVDAPLPGLSKARQAACPTLACPWVRGRHAGGRPGPCRGIHLGGADLWRCHRRAGIRLRPACGGHDRACPLAGPDLASAGRDPAGCDGDCGWRAMQHDRHCRADPVAVAGACCQGGQQRH